MPESETRRRSRGLLAAACGLVALAIAWLWWLPRDDEVLPAGAVDRAPAAPSSRMAAATSAQAASPRVEVEDDDAKTPPPAASELAHVRGRCVDENGRPLAGCTARVDGFGRNQSERALEGHVDWHDPEPVTTGDDGVFDVAFAPPRSYQFGLDLSAEGRVPRTGRWGHIGATDIVDVGDVTLQPGFVVRGRVVDEQGLPVSRVSVQLSRLPLPLAATMAANDVRYGTSDEHGDFEVRVPIPAGTWPLQVYGRGLRLVSPDHVSVDPGRGADPLLLTVRRMPKIEGVVVDERGEPIAGVEVRVDQQRSGRIASGRSRDDGTFTIYAVDEDPQPARLEIADPGPCEPTWNDDRRWPWGSTDVRIQLTRALELELTVVEAGSGAPVPRYAVRCYSERSRSSTQSELRLSGEHPGGRVIVDKVWRGKSWLQAVPLDPALLPSDKIAIEVTDAGVPPQRLQVERMAPATVRVTTEAGTPVVGSTVSVIVKGTGAFEGDLFIDDQRGAGVFSSDPTFRPHLCVSKAVTGADGRAGVLVPPHASELAVRVTGDHPRVFVDPAAWVAGRELVVTVPDSGAITGTVQGCGFDAGGLRVTVQPVDAAGDVEPSPNGDPTEPVSGDGAFAIRGLPPGLYRLTLKLLVHYDSRHGGSIGLVPLAVPVPDVEVQPGRDSEIIVDASAQQPATVHGRVLLGGAAPDHGGVVLLRDGGGRFGQYVLRSDGTFDASGLPPGSYRCGLVVGDLQAGEGDTMMQDQRFELGPGEEAARTFVFVRRRLIVTLREPDGSPAADTMVRVSGQGFDERKATDAHGVLVVDPAPEGAVRLDVAGHPSLGPITMPAGATEHAVTLTLADR